MVKTCLKVNILIFIFHLKPKTVTYVVYFDCYESWNHKDQKWHFIDQKFEKFENLSNYRNTYLKRKLRTYRIQIQLEKSTFSSIYWKNIIFSNFSSHARGPPKFFNAKVFKYFWKNVKNGFTGTWQTSKETKSWILVSKVQNLWKWGTKLTCMGHNGPYSCEIGLIKIHIERLLTVSYSETNPAKIVRNILSSK